MDKNKIRIRTEIEKLKKKKQLCTFSSRREKRK